MKAWLFLTGALLALPGHATVVGEFGGQGLYGSPYLRLGPHGAPLWENYRKRFDEHFVPLNPGVSAITVGDDQVRFDGLIKATAPGPHNAYIAMGMLLGTAYSRTSYAEARLSLVGVVSEGTNQIFDVRLGFLEHLAAGGGASVATFVSTEGGDNGPGQDLYYENWGVDGAYVHLKLVNTGPQWEVVSLQSFLGAAGSALVEGNRFSHFTDLTLDGLVNEGGGNYQLADSSASTIEVTWQVTQEGASTYFDVALGAGARVRWLLDDGVAHHGLSTTGNSDAVPYQGNGLDLEHVVPVMFGGWGGQDNMGDPQPVASLQLRFSSGTPALRGLPGRAAIHSAPSFQVIALDDAGQVDPGYRGTVHLSSTDPLAELPADYTFSAADQGARTFAVTFHTRGPQSISVAPAAFPALASEGDLQIVGKSEYDVGLGCSGTGAPRLMAALALWAGFRTLWRTLGRARSPRSVARGAAAR